MDFIIVFSAKYLIFILGLVWFVSFFFISKERQKFFFIFFAASFLIAFIGDYVFSSLYNNPRPFISEGVIPLFQHTAENGFPSGHTLFSMMFATTTFSFNRKLGIILAFFAVVVGFSRVLANVHHTIDIFGSVVLAIGSTYLAWLLVKKYFKKFGAI